MGILELCSPAKRPDLLTTLIRVRNSLDGWVSNYCFTDVHRYFKEIDLRINQLVNSFLRKIDWKFEKKSYGKMPKRMLRKKPEEYAAFSCLCSKHRKFSGIPLCGEIYALRKKAKDALLEKS